MAISCNDRIQNGSETDVDCGGTCATCDVGQACSIASDCTSLNCDAGTCNWPACDDGEQNGFESDVDCGGFCPPCPVGAGCFDGTDCESTVCQGGVCLDAQCFVDADCAALDDDCNAGACNLGTYQCEAVAINEGLACADGMACTDATCDAGMCVTLGPLDCSDLDTQCTVGECDPLDDLCAATPLPVGTPCDDGDPGTPESSCNMGTCVGALCLDVLVEDFSDNFAGWTLDTTWAIGPAVAGGGGGCGNPDPGTDHTPTADNGVAGVVIGGNAPTNIHSYYCLTSPTVDLGGASTANLELWRWLNSDVTPYMTNRIDVYDGGSWVTLWQSGGIQIQDAAWTYNAYDVTAHANAQFRLRVCHEVGSAGAFNTCSGWNLDDVVVSGCF
jgi:hypothetical protein